VTPFTDAWINTNGQVVVTTWQNIDDEHETPERRVMTPTAFHAEFGDSVPVQEGLFA
jgi:hypothetical protein